MAGEQTGFQNSSPSMIFEVQTIFFCVVHDILQIEIWLTLSKLYQNQVQQLDGH